MTVPVAVGVDNGGTWIRLKGLDTKGRCVWSLKRPSPTVEHLPGVLRHCLSRFHLSSLAVGSRGVWKQAKRRAVKRALSGLAKKIVVMSDVEAAWLAAFGTAGVRPHVQKGSDPGRGIIVISGTGSIAYGRKANGTFARAGGLGPDKGDEGSGYWIGREWLRLNPSGTSTTVRQIAALAPVVMRKAQKGNSSACKIIRTAQIHLGALVLELLQNLSWKGTVPISVSGSILENPWFQHGFFKVLRKNKIRFYFTRRVTDLAVASLMGLSVSWRGARRSPYHQV